MGECSLLLIYSARAGGYLDGRHLVMALKAYLWQQMKKVERILVLLFIDRAKQGIGR
jgi:hypothetical protein